jgi:hypothetical protein
VVEHPAIPQILNRYPAHRQLHPIAILSSMPPKTHFTIPLGNAIDAVTHSRRNKQEVHTTKCMLRQAPKEKSTLKSTAAVPDLAGALPALDNTEETHPLHVHQDQEDINIADEVGIGQSQSNASHSFP